VTYEYVHCYECLKTTAGDCGKHGAASVLGFTPTTSVAEHLCVCFQSMPHDCTCHADVCLTCGGKIVPCP
jgi:hypothetical protein